MIIKKIQKIIMNILLCAEIVLFIWGSYIALKTLINKALPENNYLRLIIVGIVIIDILAIVIAVIIPSWRKF